LRSSWWTPWGRQLRAAARGRPAREWRRRGGAAALLLLWCVVRGVGGVCRGARGGGGVSKGGSTRALSRVFMCFAPARSRARAPAGCSC
jgi:hypothetical protein